MSTREVRFHKAVCDLCEKARSGLRPERRTAAAALHDAQHYGWTLLPIPAPPSGGQRRTIAICPEHDAAGIHWCSTCKEDLEDTAWKAARDGDLLQECPAGHLNTLTPLDPATRRRPRVVTLCGSTRFAPQMADERARLTLEGAIVLGPEILDPTNPTLEGPGTPALDQLHLARIDLADEILVVDPGGYIGTSTHHEIAYARSRDKLVSRTSQLPAGA